MSKFTPGPWELAKQCSTLIMKDNRSIATAGGYTTNMYDATEENEANAHLIAAAPDMYNFIYELPCPNDCIDGAYPRMPDGEPEQCRFCYERNLLLAKARGEHND